MSKWRSEQCRLEAGGRGRAAPTKKARLLGGIGRAGIEAIDSFAKLCVRGSGFADLQIILPTKARNTPKLEKKGEEEEGDLVRPAEGFGGEAALAREPIASLRALSYWGPTGARRVSPDEPHCQMSFANPHTPGREVLRPASHTHIGNPQLNPQAA